MHVVKTKGLWKIKYKAVKLVNCTYGDTLPSPIDPDSSYLNARNVAI